MIKDDATGLYMEVEPEHQLLLVCGVALTRYGCGWFDEHISMLFKREAFKAILEKIYDVYGAPILKALKNKRYITTDTKSIADMLAEYEERGYHPDHYRGIVLGLVQEIVLMPMYKKLIANEPPAEVKGHYPLEAIKNHIEGQHNRTGFRRSVSLAEYIAALKDPVLYTSLLIPGVDEYSTARDSYFWPNYIEHASQYIDDIFDGTRSVRSIAPKAYAQKLADLAYAELCKMGVFPETLMAVRRYQAFDPYELTRFIGMGLHLSPSWGMIATQLSREIREVMWRHGEQFSAWPELEPERHAIREQVLALMLRLQREKDAKSMLDEYFNRGGSAAGIARNKIDTLNKLRVAIENLRRERTQRNRVPVPLSYRIPEVALPEGWAWADAPTFAKLSEIYGNCISNSPQYAMKINEGVAHVLYRPQRGKDAQGRTGGAVAFISFANGRWAVREISGFQNNVAHREYRQEADKVAASLNRNPDKHIHKLEAKELEKVQNPYQVLMPPTVFNSYQRGVMLAELYCAYKAHEKQQAEQQETTAA